MLTRKRVFEIIEKSQKNDTASAVFDGFLITLIILNIIAVVASSFDAIYAAYNHLLRYFEIFSITVFTLEYTVRIWAAPEKYHKSKHPYLRYIFSFMALVDLASIIPFFLPFVVHLDLRVLRTLRLVRLLRLLKLNRYNNSLNILARVMKTEKDKLFMTVFITGLMLLLASTLMYNIENAVQPDKFPNILATLWWAVATLTTVGYGDVYPLTNLGKILSGVIAILGIGLVALPSGIISAGLLKEVSKHDKKPIKCPHCGKEIKSADMEEE